LFFGRLDAAPFDDADCFAGRLVVLLFYCSPRHFCWLSRCLLDAWWFDQFDVALLVAFLSMLGSMFLLLSMPLNSMLARFDAWFLVVRILHPSRMLLALLLA
jgi:hypothetical protein